MRKAASLASTILITILCYSAFDYYNIEHNKKHRKHQKVQKPSIEPINNTLRPWEECETASRYVFLKKHKVASRYVILFLAKWD